MNWFCLTKKGSDFRGFGGTTLCKLPSSAPGNLLYSHCAQRRLYLQKKKEAFAKLTEHWKYFVFSLVLFCFVFILGPILYNTTVQNNGKSQISKVNLQFSSPGPISKNNSILKCNVITFWRKLNLHNFFPWVSMHFSLSKPHSGSSTGGAPFIHSMVALG